MTSNHTSNSLFFKSGTTSHPQPPSTNNEPTDTMPQRKFTISTSSHRYPHPHPPALTSYLSTGGTLSALARHLMARPLLTSVAILQQEYEAGMDAHSQTPPGRKVTIETSLSGIGGFLHPSYSRAVLLPSEPRFDRVVRCAGLLDSPEWLACRPLPGELSTEEAYALGRYFERVVEVFEEVVEEGEEEEEGKWAWVEELDEKWVAAVKAKATGPGVAEVAERVEFWGDMRRVREELLRRRMNGGTV